MPSEKKQLFQNRKNKLLSYIFRIKMIFVLIVIWFTFIKLIEVDRQLVLIGSLALMMLGGQTALAAIKLVCPKCAGNFLKGKIGVSTPFFSKKCGQCGYQL